MQIRELSMHMHVTVDVMLHLGDAFGFSDLRGENEVPSVDLRCHLATLLDLNPSPSISFTPKQLADTVRMTANEIFQVFYNQLESSATLSVVQRAIAVVMPNSSELVFTFLAIGGLSMIACPMYSTLSTFEFKYAMKQMGVSLLIVGEHGNVGAQAAAKQLHIPCAVFKWDLSTTPPTPLVGFGDHDTPAPLSPQLVIAPKEFETCVKFHTAGVCAKPKLVSLTHRNIVLSLANIQKTYAWRSYSGEECDPEDMDVGICVTSLSHAHGLIAGCLAPLANQSTVAIAPAQPQGGGFLLETFWADARRCRATWVTLTPSLLRELVKSQDEGYSKNPVELRFIRVTSQPLDSQLALEAEEKFKTVVIQAYALTEASHQVCSNGYPTITDRRPGSVGKPTGTEVAILDTKDERKCCAIDEPGEIWIRGYNVMDSCEDAADPTTLQSLSHNSIDWMSCGRHPSFLSAAFDLSPGVHRSFSSSVRSLTMQPQADSQAWKPRSEMVELPNDLVPPPSAGCPLVSPIVPCKRAPLLRFASALEPYLDQDFPQRFEPMISPLPLQIEWIKTGDTGRMAADGYIYIIARSRDIIIRGGARISPYEIEEVYETFEEIQEAAAFGVKDERLGEELHIAVTLADGFEISPEMISSFRSRAKESLAAFKLPSDLHVVKALPKDPAGRLHREQLPEYFGSGS